MLLLSSLPRNTNAWCYTRTVRTATSVYGIVIRWNTHCTYSTFELSSSMFKVITLSSMHLLRNVRVNTDQVIPDHWKVLVLETVGSANIREVERNFCSCIPSTFKWSKSRPFFHVLSHFFHFSHQSGSTGWPVPEVQNSRPQFTVRIPRICWRLWWLFDDSRSYFLTKIGVEFCSPTSSRYHIFAVSSWSIAETSRKERSRMSTSYGVKNEDLSSPAFAGMFRKTGFITV